MDFFKALFVWCFMALIITAAIVATVKGGIVGILALVAVAIIYIALFTVYGCKSH